MVDLDATSVEMSRNCGSVHLQSRYSQRISFWLCMFASLCFCMFLLIWNLIPFLNQIFVRAILTWNVEKFCRSGQYINYFKINILRGSILKEIPSAKCLVLCICAADDIIIFETFCVCYKCDFKLKHIVKT